MQKLFSSVVSGLVIAVILCVSVVAWAQLVLEPVADIAKIKEQLILTPKAYVFRDSSASLSFREIASPAFFHRFEAIGQDNINEGYTQARYWVRFALENTADEPKTVLLEQVYPLIDTVMLYEVGSGGLLQSRMMGDMVLRSKSKEVDFRHPVFHVRLAPFERRLYYMSFRTEGTMSITLRLWERDAFAEYMSRNQLGFGIYYGVMLVMMLYNFFIFLFLRERGYLLYVLNIFALILFQSSYTGFSYQYLLGEVPWLNHVLFPASIGLLSFSGIAFGYYFLDIEHVLPGWRRAFWAAMGLALLAFLLAFVLPHTVSNRSAAALSMLLVLFLIWASVLVHQRGHAAARFFLLAWALYLVGAVLTLVRAFGGVPTNFFTFYGIQIGSAIEVVLLALGLAYRIDVLRKEVARKELEKERIAREKEQEKLLLIQEQNLRLEELVEARTIELESINRRLTDSIRYAQRIQEAILPHKEAILACFHDAFIFYQPRDIVSGDFYWFAETNDKVLLAAIDCTGHGVPGAFMSLIGNTLLNQIVYERNISRPAEILRQLHHEVRVALKQEEGTGSDGMDVALCAFHKNMEVIEYAGAYRPLWYVEDGLMKEIKGDQVPIGGVRRGLERRYTNHLIDISRAKDVELFLFSDGFADQFGGDKRRKYMLGRFRQLIEKTSRNFHTAKSQHLFLHKEFEEWRGRESQIDDILVIGIRVKQDGVYSLHKTLTQSTMA